MMRKSCGRPECKKDSRGVACRACGEVNYCSDECQRQHWAHGHKDECTKIEELGRLYSKAAESKDQKTIERVFDVWVIAVRNYCSKRLASLRGLPVDFAEFLPHFSKLISWLAPCTKTEEHFRVLSEALDEAERLHQERKLLHYLIPDFDIPSTIQSHRALLFAMKGRVLMQAGDAAGSSAAFTHAQAVAGAIEDPKESAQGRAMVEITRGRAYVHCGHIDKAILCYEDGYVIQQEFCSPDNFNLQETTKELARLYRKTGDHEKADYFAEIAIQSLEQYYYGQHRVEIGFIYEGVSEGILDRINTCENDDEKRNALFTEYELKIRKAVEHYKGHDFVSPPQVFSLYDARRMYHKATDTMIKFADEYKRFQSSDLHQIFNDNIDLSLEFGEYEGVSSKPMIKCYTKLLIYYNYRDIVGPALASTEGKIRAKRIKEFKVRFGYSDRQFDDWYKRLIKQFGGFESIAAKKE